MEWTHSLPCSQLLTTYPSPEPYDFTTFPSYSFKIQLMLTSHLCRGHPILLPNHIHISVSLHKCFIPHQTYSVCLIFIICTNKRTHTHTHTYIYTHTHTHIYTYISNIILCPLKLLNIKIIWNSKPLYGKIVLLIKCGSGCMWNSKALFWCIWCMNKYICVCVCVCVCVCICWYK